MSHRPRSDWDCFQCSQTTVCTMCFARVQNSSSVQFSLCRVNEALSETNNLNMVTRQLLINNIGAYCCCRQQPCELLVRFRDVWEKRALQVHNTTRSSAIADGARCVLSVEILPIATQQCRVETTCTTSPEQIEVIKLEGYSGPMCNKHVHSTMTRSCRFHCCCHKQTNHGRVVYITCIPTTCCGEIFLVHLVEIALTLTTST